jgi:hypothetical protein
MSGWRDGFSGEIMLLHENDLVWGRTTDAMANCLDRSRRHVPAIHERFARRSFRSLIIMLSSATNCDVK